MSDGSGKDGRSGNRRADMKMWQVMETSSRGGGGGGGLETVSLLDKRLILIHQQLCLLHVSVGQHLLLCELGHGFLGGVERLLQLCDRFGVRFLGGRSLRGSEREILMMVRG